MPFFITPGSKRAGSRAKTRNETVKKKCHKRLKQRRDKVDDEEIDSDDADNEVVTSDRIQPDTGYASDEDAGDAIKVVETAEEKRLRLAKAYLAEIESEERSRQRDQPGCDAQSDVQFAVQNKLEEHRQLAQGTLKCHIADQLAEASLDSIRSTVLRDNVVLKSSVTCLCPSGDGKYLFAASKQTGLVQWMRQSASHTDSFVKSHRLKVCQAVDLAPSCEPSTVKDCRQHSKTINDMSISSDGHFLATASADKTIKVWDVPSLRLYQTLTGHRESVTGVAYRKYSCTLFSCSDDKSVKVWKAGREDGKYVFVYVETLFGHQDVVSGIDAGIAERCITVGGMASGLAVRVWKIVEQSQLVYSPPNSVTSMFRVRLINEQLFVTAGDDGHLSLWAMAKKRPLATVPTVHGLDEQANARWVVSLAAVPNGDVIATGSNEGLIRLWRIGKHFRSIEPLVNASTGLQLTLAVVGVINELAFVGNQLFAAVGQEHCRGRWWPTNRVARNAVHIFDLPM